MGSRLSQGPLQSLRQAHSPLPTSERQNAVGGKGFEPGCALPNSYTALLVAKSVRSSGTTTSLEVSGNLTTPNGGKTDIDPASVTAMALPMQDPFADADRLRRKAEEVADVFVKNLAKKLGKTE